jgi:hypothetical protein
MTAAHISHNVFSLRDFLGTYMYYFLLYIQPHSYLLYITFEQTILLLITEKSTLSFLQFFIAGRLPSVSRVQYSLNAANFRIQLTVNYLIY